MRIPIIAGNWKMNATPDEAEALASGLAEKFLRYSKVIIAIFPPFPYLLKSFRILKGGSIRLGAQNMHWEGEGPFTGEVSGTMLKAVGCSMVILGHSERRILFGETDSVIARKIKAALGFGLTPIVCIGETLEEREAGKQEGVVERQLTNCLVDVTADEVESLVVAYEPVWAIGTGKTATPEQAQDMQAAIRHWINNRYGKKKGDALNILYGGSVNPKNSKELLSQPDVDGALVGGASLKLDSFAAIIAAAEETLKGATT